MKSLANEYPVFSSRPSLYPDPNPSRDCYSKSLSFVPTRCCSAKVLLVDATDRLRHGGRRGPSCQGPHTTIHSEHLRVVVLEERSWSRKCHGRPETQMGVDRKEEDRLEVHLGVMVDPVLRGRVAVDRAVHLDPSLAARGSRVHRVKSRIVLAKREADQPVVQAPCASGHGEIPCRLLRSRETCKCPLLTGVREPGPEMCRRRCDHHESIQGRLVGLVVSRSSSSGSDCFWSGSRSHPASFEVGQS